VIAEDRVDRRRRSRGTAASPTMRRDHRIAAHGLEDVEEVEQDQDRDGNPEEPKQDAAHGYTP
jgi:hypothetical protein